MTCILRLLVSNICGLLNTTLLLSFVPSFLHFYLFIFLLRMLGCHLCLSESYPVVQCSVHGPPWSLLVPVCQSPLSACDGHRSCHLFMPLTKSFVLSLFLDTSHICSLTVTFLRTMTAHSGLYILAIPAISARGYHT